MTNKPTGDGCDQQTCAVASLASESHFTLAVEPSISVPARSVVITVVVILKAFVYVYRKTVHTTALVLVQRFQRRRVCIFEANCSPFR